jgi:hypothetical protein
VTGTLLSSRNTGTNEQETLLLELLGPSDGVGVVGVTAINNNITFLEMGDELSNERVNGVAGFDEEDNFAWPLQLSNKLLDRVSTLDVGTYKAKGPSVRLRVENKVEGNN